MTDRRESKAWRAIAQNIERNGGAFVGGSGYGREGICRGIETHAPTQRIKSRMFARLKAFYPDAETPGAKRYFYWPGPECRNKRSGRTLAAWLLFWQAIDAEDQRQAGLDVGCA